MDAKELIVSILEYLVASIPMILTTVLLLVKNFGLIKKEVSSFNQKVAKSEVSVTDKVETKINYVLEKVENRLVNTVDKVDKTLENIGERVDGFDNRIVALTAQVEHLFKTNKVSFDIISLLVSDNQELINRGVASIIVNKMNLTKEEIESYPELISTDKESFVKAIKEQYALLGKEQFEDLLLKTVKELGYGKEE